MKGAGLFPAVNIPNERSCIPVKIHVGAGTSSDRYKCVLVCHTSRPDDLGGFDIAVLSNQAIFNDCRHHGC